MCYVSHGNTCNYDINSLFFVLEYLIIKQPWLGHKKAEKEEEWKVEELKGATLHTKEINMITSHMMKYDSFYTLLWVKLRLYF